MTKNVILLQTTNEDCFVVFNHNYAPAKVSLHDNERDAVRELALSVGTSDAAECMQALTEDPVLVSDLKWVKVFGCSSVESEINHLLDLSALLGMSLPDFLSFLLSELRNRVSVASRMSYFLTLALLNASVTTLQDFQEGAVVSVFSGSSEAAMLEMQDGHFLSRLREHVIGSSQGIEESELSDISAFYFDNVDGLSGSPLSVVMAGSYHLLILNAGTPELISVSPSFDLMVDSFISYTTDRLRDILKVSS